ncbi:hypothetical protein [Clostridium perfringens]|uniref:hypothetical protein n=1 Tax=Clostridium perfringens TaxID=1502 RepID=UPI0039E91C42
MKINVGDKIKLKELRECQEMNLPCYITDSMMQFFGKTVTVHSIVSSNRVQLEEDSSKYCFATAWIEYVIPADKSKEFKLTKDMEGKKVILKPLTKCHATCKIYITSDMERYFGKPVTISTVFGDGTFTIREDVLRFYFAEEWIDREYTAPEVYTGERIEDTFRDTMRKSIDNTAFCITKVIVNNRCVIVLGLDKNTGKKVKAVAKCANTDEFDIQKGFEIAVTRASIKVQQSYLKELIK